MPRHFDITQRRFVRHRHDECRNVSYNRSELARLASLILFVKARHC